MYCPDFKDRLTVSNSDYLSIVLDFFRFIVKCDKAEEDVSSDRKSLRGNAVLKIRTNEECMLSGIEELSAICSYLELEFVANFADGSCVGKGEVIAEISGQAAILLAYERTFLNLIARFISITTQSAKFIDVLARFKNPIRVLSTRKCLLSVLDKKAASVAGICTHRLDLAQGLMIKDNHFEAIDFANLNDLCRTNIEFYEFEFDSIAQIRSVLDSLIDFFDRNKGGILLDNMSKDEIVECIDFLSSKNRNFFIEASGGVKLETLSEFDIDGLDFVSTSDIYNYSDTVDLSAELEMK